MPAADATPADWLVGALRTFGASVLSLVPAGFSAYIRIFHPAYRNEGDALRPVLWRKIAEANAAHAHAGMQLCALTGSCHSETGEVQPGVYDHAPREGSLPTEVAGPLVRVLARHTMTPERCWFAIWNGFGAMPDDVRQAPTFHLPARDYHLLTGPVVAAADEDLIDAPWGQSANLWWPDDGAWCVATEIDLKTTYVGCDETCREDILAQSELEALPINPATGIDWRSDLLNPLEESPYGDR
jgi:hypothetical protein